MKRFKNGFTMAETLIVLSLIGIVAAITVSSLVQNFQKRQMLTGLKTAYSLVSEITRRAEVEHGPFTTWPMNTETVFNTYFRPYLSITKDCGQTTSQNIAEQCFYSENGGWYDLKNQEMQVGHYSTQRSFYKVVLKNGMSFGIVAHNRNSGNPKVEASQFHDRFYIVVDINGKRGKSILGKDVFMFTIVPRNGVNSEGNYTANERLGLNMGFIGDYDQSANSSKDYNKSANLLSKNCSKTANSDKWWPSGSSCGRVLELEGWKIPKNYPW